MNPKPTKLGQRILDALSDYNWPIDQSAEPENMQDLPQLTRDLAARLNLPLRTVAGGWAHLVKQGLAATECNSRKAVFGGDSPSWTGLTEVGRAAQRKG